MYFPLNTKQIENERMTMNEVLSMVAFHTLTRLTPRDTKTRNE